MRLIDADVIDKRYVPIAPVFEGDAVHYEWIAFVEDINEQPTIDAEPVKHGKWEETVNSHCTCTACGSEWSFFENETERFDYCPNCGAKMMSGKEGGIR